MSDDNKNWTQEILEEFYDPWDDKDLIRTAERAAEDAQSRAAKIVEDSTNLIAKLGIENDRHMAATELLDCLVPNIVDLKLWQAVALGQNVHLPASDQYGRIEDRLKPSDDRARGAAPNKMHSKGEAPSQFIKRQGGAITASAKDIARLETDLEVARQRHQQLESGTKMFAAVCLATAIRDAAAPVFAMGPAWTILKAIRGTTGMEVSPKDQQVQTQTILVTLHALLRDEQFGQEIKNAILAVCYRYSTKAKAASYRDGEFNGPYDYEDLLEGLEWAAHFKE